MNLDVVLDEQSLRLISYPDWQKVSVSKSFQVLENKLRTLLNLGGYFRGLQSHCYYHCLLESPAHGRGVCIGWNEARGGGTLTPRSGLSCYYPRVHPQSYLSSKILTIDDVDCSWKKGYFLDVLIFCCAMLLLWLKIQFAFKANNFVNFYLVKRILVLASTRYARYK